MHQRPYDARGNVGYGDVRLTALPDGKILMLVWTWLYTTEETQSAHRCLSADGGLTWTQPEPTNVRCQIMSPFYHKEDVVIAVSNLRTPPVPGIHLVFSRTAGKEWNADSPVLMWDAVHEQMQGKSLKIKGSAMDEAQEKIWKSLPGFTFGTPDLLRIEENQFLLSYYATKDKVMHARACSFELLEL
jgi:hypothetical protein